MTQQIVMRKIADLRPYAGNARTHSRKQIGQIARSIGRFGFTNPVLVADNGEILAGHGRASRWRVARSTRSALLFSLLQSGPPSLERLEASASSAGVPFPPCSATADIVPKECRLVSMDTPLVAYPLVAIAPLALHWSSQLGTMLLEPVRTGAPLFDRTYNGWPWLPSVLCGLFLVLALALQSLSGALVYLCLAAALTCFVVDAIASSISFYRWAQKRR